MIRSFLKGALPKDSVRHAYIPDISGKERRKKSPGKEGKLGVEGMEPAVLLEALRRAGATFCDEPARMAQTSPHHKADLYNLGLSGGPGSREKTSGAFEASLPAGTYERQRHAGGAEISSTIGRRFMQQFAP